MPSPSTRPLIGVTGRRRKAGQIAGFHDALGHLDADLYLTNYNVDVMEAGGLPVLLPLDGDPLDYLPHLDGLVLTGGADLEPHRYDYAPDGAGTYEPERDDVELRLAVGALEAALPILGICRGLQLLNVATGGSLHQDVPAHSRYDVDPAGSVHDVYFSEHSRLSLLYGDGTEVNSLHHQTVHRLGDGFVVTGRAHDNTIEGMEMPGRDVIAVQWHPEMRPHREPVFDWVVKRAASQRAAG
ncbi:MAG: gamma-glutamyl-gamma-aminobutyrate hydrolase family protein [Acidimicrobiia bacterium]|nr:gamma-glutamyl-gamma-aminobutyrate hydrolase family protein [Acidimicrobiia bacterium]